MKPIPSVWSVIIAGLQANRYEVALAPLFATEPRDIEQRLDAARRVFDEVDLFLAPSAFIAGELQSWLNRCSTPVCCAKPLRIRARGE